MGDNFGRRVPDDISAGAGPWFVQIWGIGNDYTWQTLKDAVRPHAPHVGYVQVYQNGKAIIACRKWEEAKRCFENLSAGSLGRPLYVELWETTPDRAPRLIWKNIERLPPQAAAAANIKAGQYYPSQLSPPMKPQPLDELGQYMACLRMDGQEIPPELIVAYRGLQVQAMQATKQALLQQPASNSIYPISTGASVSYARQQQPQPSPMFSPQYAARQVNIDRAPHYATNSSGIPTNIERGTIRTELRGVFVSNLSYDIQKDDIHKLFSRFGTIAKVDHKQESKTYPKGKPSSSKSKGSAIVTFATSEEAKRAIAGLNGVRWRDRDLLVRPDTEPTPVDLPPSRADASVSSKKCKRNNNDGHPLIVDGSRYGRQS